MPIYSNNISPSKIYSGGRVDGKVYNEGIKVWPTGGDIPLPPKTNDYLYKLLDIDSDGVVSQYTGEIPADYYSGITYFDDNAALNLYLNNDGLTGKLYFPDLEYIGQSGFANAYTDTGAKLYFPKLNDIYQDVASAEGYQAFTGVVTICHFSTGMQGTMQAFVGTYGLNISQCVFDLWGYYGSFQFCL